MPRRDQLPSPSAERPVPRLRRSRERILAAIRDAAITEFGLHGYEGASTQRIAEGAGLTKPQLHYYITGKQDLYEELLYAVLRGWSDAFRFDCDENDPSSVLSSYVRRKLDYAIDHPDLSRIFTSELLSGGKRLGKYWPVARHSTQQKVEIIERWISCGLIRPLDPRILLMQIWAMTQHYADYAVQVRVMLDVSADAPIDRAPIARELTTSVLLTCGLAPDCASTAQE